METIGHIRKVVVNHMKNRELSDSSLDTRMFWCPLVSGNCGPGVSTKLSTVQISDTGLTAMCEPGGSAREGDALDETIYRGS
jgi:hypothetical protein